MSTKFPLEIPETLGLSICSPESAAAARAGRGEGSALCQAAEKLGYAPDLCSYVRMGLSLASRQGEGDLPQPDFLLCCDNICSGMVQWYQAMARTLGVPLFLVNVPYGQRGESGVTTYIRRQLEVVIQGLEKLTGRQWKEERFAQVCSQANRTAQAWQRVLDTARKNPAPLDSMEIFNFMPQMVTGRCRVETEQALIKLETELRRRSVQSKQMLPYRVFWEGTPCWPVLHQVLLMLNSRGIQVVADPISQSLGFQYTDLDGLVRAYCGTLNGVLLEEGVTQRVQWCRRYQVDGVLVHYNRSCRPWCGWLPEVERRLRQELEVPVVCFDGDQGEASVFSAGAFALRLDALVEQMAAMRKRAV